MLARAEEKGRKGGGIRFRNRLPTPFLPFVIRMGGRLIGTLCAACGVGLLAFAVFVFIDSSRGMPTLVRPNSSDPSREWMQHVAAAFEPGYKERLARSRNVQKEREADTEQFVEYLRFRRLNDTAAIGLTALFAAYLPQVLLWMSKRIRRRSRSSKRTTTNCEPDIVSARNLNTEA